MNPRLSPFVLAATIALVVCTTQGGWGSATQDSKKQALKAGSIEGTLVSAKSRPIANATVAVVPENEGISEEASRPAVLVRTSRDGHFRIVGLAPGSYSVTATMGGHFAAIQAGLIVKAGRAVRGVRLRAATDGLELAGSIRNTSGDPIPGAQVRAIRYSDLLGDVFYAFADSSGRFSIRLPRAQYLLLAVAPGREPVSKRQIAEENRALTFTLPTLYPPGPAPDEVVDWFRRTGVPLRTAQPGRGYSDLQPLREWIADARVVSLGEATHGTREFFQIKHRMLEFLVREMGFNVFAIEATMPESFDLNEYVLTGRGDPANALSGLYFWTWDTQEVLEMIRWMRRYNADPVHRRKVKFYGFDMQFAPRAAKAFLSYLRRVDPMEAHLAAEALAPLDDPYRAQRVKSLSEPKSSELAAVVSRYLSIMDSRKAEFSRITGERDWAVARQHVRVLCQYMENARGDWRVRDKAMAENIAWILDHEGTDAKVVVWAHNGHVTASEDQELMGFHLRRQLGERMVVFGFAFNQGSFQAINGGPGKRGLVTFTVPPAPVGSLDETLSRTRHRIAAFDLRAPRKGPVAEWLAAPHETRTIGAGFNDSLPGAFLARQIAPQNYNALLFVERTTAARPNKSGPGIASPMADTTSNLDFEEGSVGKAPPGWSAAGGRNATAYRAEISRDRPRNGARCALIRSLPASRYGERTGTLSRVAPAAPYAGGRVRLRASVRVKGDPDCRAYLWLRGSKPGFGPSAETFYQGTDEAPITSPDWREFEVVGEVSKETMTLDYGLALVGSGTAWIDAVALETVER